VRVVRRRGRRVLACHQPPRADSCVRRLARHQAWHTPAREGMSVQRVAGTVHQKLSQGHRRSRGSAARHIRWRLSSGLRSPGEAERRGQVPLRRGFDQLGTKLFPCSGSSVSRGVVLDGQPQSTQLGRQTTGGAILEPDFRATSWRHFGAHCGRPSLPCGSSKPDICPSLAATTSKGAAWLPPQSLVPYSMGCRHNGGSRR
jgi:hypothetical protein